METEQKRLLRALHDSILPRPLKQSPADSFRHCMEAFTSTELPRAVDSVAASKGLETIIRRSGGSDVSANEARIRRFNSLREELQNCQTLKRLPDHFVFLHQLAASNLNQSGDGLLQNFSENRRLESSSPESGFATTPADGPPGGTFLGGRKFVPFPESDVLLMPLPPNFKQNPTLPRITEHELIRDLFCVIQGFDGELVKLTSDGCRFAAGKEVEGVMGKLALQIGYCGWLCQRLKKFCMLKERDPASGICSQKLCNVVHEELQMYRKSVVGIDTQIHQEDSNPLLTAQSNRSLRLTLRKFHTSICDGRDRLYFLHSVTDAVAGFKGGQLLTALHNCAHHGDTTVQSVTSKLIYAAVEPLLQHIRRWIFFGQLDDKFNEFFIGLDPSVPKEQYWSTRYQVRDVMIPYFISADLAKQLFTGGKSVAFMRNFCAGPSVITGMDVYSSLSDCSFTGSDPIWHFHNNQLKAMDAASLLGACKLANRNVTNLLKNDHNLGAHLSGLRNFLLMGQGDVILYLMDNLKETLSEPAGQLLLRDLTATLNDAIRSTNAQFTDPDVLDSLDTIVQILGKETGWDAFSLEYRTVQPLATVLSTDIIERYKRVFAYLWRLKRAEFLLCEIWKNAICFRAATKVTPGYEGLAFDVHLTLHRMLQFVQQIQCSFDIEVLKIGWSAFSDRFSSAESLDDIMASHNDFLHLVEDKCFIPKSMEDRPVGALEIRIALDQIVEFDSFWCAMQRAASLERERILQKGETDLDGEFHMKTFPKLSARLQTLHSSFKGGLRRLTPLLESSGDPAVRLHLDYESRYGKSEKRTGNQEVLNAAGFDDSGRSV